MKFEAQPMRLLTTLAVLLLVIWAVLMLLGKGGFIHLLILNAVGLLMVELVTICRTRMTETNPASQNGIQDVN
jgi:hypothetical protein